MLIEDFARDICALKTADGFRATEDCVPGGAVILVPGLTDYMFPTFGTLVGPPWSRRREAISCFPLAYAAMSQQTYALRARSIWWSQNPLSSWALRQLGDLLATVLGATVDKGPEEGQFAGRQLAYSTPIFQFHDDMLDRATGRTRIELLERFDLWAVAGGLELEIVAPERRRKRFSKPIKTELQRLKLLVKACEFLAQDDKFDDIED